VLNGPVETITQGLLLRYKPLNLDVLPLFRPPERQDLWRPYRFCISLSFWAAAHTDRRGKASCCRLEPLIKCSQQSLEVFPSASTVHPVL
jgi:hypothetical protein